MICTLTDLCIYYIMSGDIAAQGFRQVCADFKRKDTVQMIPIVIMAIEDESDRDYITGLFLKNERGMYGIEKLAIQSADRPYEHTKGG